MILERLSQAIGVSGEEDEVRDILQEALRGHVQDMSVDALGNLCAIQRGSEQPDFRVMIAAHMDEVGLMVTAVDSNGLLQFTNVGGIDPRILPGMRVKVGPKRRPGVILWKPIHMGRDTQALAIDALRIDVGAEDKSAAQPGDRIAFDSAYRQLSPDVVRGKAFDDRVGCAILVDILQQGPYPVTVAAAFTAQEEVGLRGATVAVRRLEPHAAIVLEGTTANDIPDPNYEAAAGDLPPRPTARLGAGVALTLSDGSLIPDPRAIAFLQETAAAHDIPVQMKAFGGSATDGGAIYSAQGGIPTMVLSVPCRYIHSPYALMNLQDYRHTLALAQAALRRIRPATFQRD